MQLEDFMNVIVKDEENDLEAKKDVAEIQNLIDELEMFSNNTKLLTNSYTKILQDENVVHLLTRISQNKIFKENFPEFYLKSQNDESVINCQQNSPYHKYGVFRHILYTVEYVGGEMVKCSASELRILKWTMLLHDIGKPFVKSTNSEGRDSFAGHEEVSEQMAKEILERFNFSEDEKEIIAILIRYHDRYLNEGEITCDNLTFLAQELKNKKRWFDLLIEVKNADNRAKSIDVYNKWLAVRDKYYKFSNEYFTDSGEQYVESNGEEEELIVSFDGNSGNSQEDILGTDSANKGLDKSLDEKRIKEKVDKNKFKEIYDSILNEQKANYMFSPIMDVHEKKILAYEIITDIQDNIDMQEFFEMAKKEDKFKKLNQLLFVGAIDFINKIKGSDNVKYMIDTDYQSFIEYNNKSRIFDALEKNEIIICFDNYDVANPGNINETNKFINKKHGEVCLNNFESSKFDSSDLKKLEVSFIKYTIKEDDEKFKEIIDVGMHNKIKVIAAGVDAKEKLEIAASNKLNYMQGKFLFDDVVLPEVSEEQLVKVDSILK